MIKYRTEFFKIEAIEVLRETDKQFVVSKFGRERRVNKISRWSNWHDTWEEAHVFLVSDAQAKIYSLRTQLDQANGKLAQIKGMKSSVELTGGALAPSSDRRERR